MLKGSSSWFCGHSVALGTWCPCWTLPFSSAVMLAVVAPPYLHASGSLQSWELYKSMEACRNECVRAYTLDNSNKILLPACLVEHPLSHMRSTVQSTHWGVLTLAIIMSYLDLPESRILWHPFEVQSSGCKWGRVSWFSLG